MCYKEALIDLFKMTDNLVMLELSVRTDLSYYAK